MKACITILGILAMSARLAIGQEVLPDPEAILNGEGTPPPATENSSSVTSGPAGRIQDLAPERLREILTSRVDKLRKIPTEKGLYLPFPARINENERGAFIGYKEIEYKYRIEKRQIPRYKYEYEEYEDYVQVPASNEPYEKRMVYKKIKSQRVTSHRVVGYDTREVKVPDPSGPHTGISKVAQYENASSAYLHHGWFGSNAMALLGMLKSGLPATDTKLQPSLESLTHALYAYGAPDRTWDLAWVAALFVNLPQDNPQYHDWAVKSVGKLLAGVNMEGPGAGLWGPNCVNPEYIAAIIQYDQRYGERYLQPIATEIARERRERSKLRLMEKQQALLEIHSKWAFVYKIWGICGLNPYAPTQSHVYPAELKRQPKVTHTASGRVPGLTCEFNRYRLADLECTALALFALKEAASQNLLPDEPGAPYDTKLKPLVKSQTTRKILEKSLAALLAFRKSDGRWDSCSRFAEHKAFSKIELNESTINGADFQNLPSRKHSIYQVLACASLRYLTSCLDGAAAAKAESVSEPLLDTLWPELEPLGSHLVIEDLPGRHAAVWHLAEICGSGSRDARRTWEALALGLLKRTAADESKPSTWARTPPNWRVYSLTLAQARGFLEVSAEEMLIRQRELLKPKDSKPGATLPAGSFNGLDAQSALYYASDIVTDATTLAFLASGIRPPAFAFWRQQETTEAIPVEVRVVSDVYRKRKVSVETVRVRPDLPLDDIANTPFVVLRQSGIDFTPTPAARKSLTSYLTKHKGTLLVLCDDDDGGDAFLKGLEGCLKEQAIRGAWSEGTEKGIAVRTLQLDDRPVVQCIRSAPGGSESRQVARTIDSFLKKKLAPIYFEPDYPLMLDRLEQ